MRFGHSLACLAILCAALPATADEPPAPPATGNRVRVFLDSVNPRAQLLRMDRSFEGSTGRQRSASSAASVVECDAPCGIAVDARAAYTVGGPGIVPSATFRLPPGGEVRLHVTAPGSLRAGQAGLWLTRLAVFPVTVTAIVLVGIGPQTANNNLYYGAAGLAALGLTMLAVGIPLFVLNRTIVTNDVGMRLGALQLTPRGIVF